MSESVTVTITGLEEFGRAAAQVVDVVRTARRTAASASGARVAASARARLNAVTHGTGATAASITAKTTSSGKVLIGAEPVRGRHPLLVVWLEYGTVKMPARPFMRPATEAERAPFHKQQEAVANDALRALFKD